MRGAYKHDPARAKDRAHEPKPTGDIGPCPNRLVGPEIEAWTQIVTECHTGVLCSADRLAVELLARLTAESWVAGPAFACAKAARMSELLGAFGMKPADRSKVAAANPAEKKNPFSDIIKGKRA